MLWIVIGMILLLAGMVSIVFLGMWGLFVLLAGAVCMFVGYRAMMLGSGKHPDQSGTPGFGAGEYGRQQSETIPRNAPVIGEQPSDIWEQVTEDKQ